jgi:hypothetical protein
MALQIEEVLSLWREAERLLDELPAEAPEREVVSAEVVRLRRMYKRLTDESDVSAHMIGAAQDTMAKAKSTFDQARAALERQASSDPA